MFLRISPVFLFIPFVVNFIDNFFPCFDTFFCYSFADLLSLHSKKYRRKNKSSIFGNSLHCCLKFARKVGSIERNCDGGFPIRFNVRTPKQCVASIGHTALTTVFCRMVWCMKPIRHLWGYITYHLRGSIQIQVLMLATIG